MFPKKPSQPTTAATVSSQATRVLTMVGGTQAGQLAISSQIQAALKCKLPGCDKPCFVESNGQAYDYCSKAHARAYTSVQQKQPQQLLPQMFPSTLSPSGPPMPDGMLTWERACAFILFISSFGKAYTSTSFTWKGNQLPIQLVYNLAVARSALSVERSQLIQGRDGARIVTSNPNKLEHVICHR